MAKKIEIEIDDETEQMLAELQAGHTLTKIGQKRGHGHSWALYRLFWFVPRGANVRNGWDVDAGIQDYNSGLTQAEVGRKYGVSVLTVCRVFKKRGVKTRGPGSPGVRRKETYPCGHPRTDENTVYVGRVHTNPACRQCREARGKSAA